MSSFHLSSNSRTVAIIEGLDLRGEGRAWPRLIFSGTIRSPGPHFSTRFLELAATVKFGEQAIGIATLNQLGEYYGELAVGMEMPMPITHAAIQYIEHHTTGHELDFSLDFRGLLLAKDDTPLQERRWQSEFDPGAWTYAAIRGGTGSVATVKIARSKWLKEVLERIGIGEYVLMELKMPPAQYGQAMAKALVMLKEAEEQFRLGHDPGVFQHCHAAFEVLAGWPKQILDRMADRAKAAQVDAMLKGITNYLHTGRHPSKAGDDAGTFAVDHQDAEYALGLSKMTVAYIARLLATSG